MSKDLWPKSALRCTVQKLWHQISERRRFLRHGICRFLRHGIRRFLPHGICRYLETFPNGKLTRKKWLTWKPKARLNFRDYYSPRSINPVEQTRTEGLAALPLNSISRHQQQYVATWCPHMSKSQGPGSGSWGKFTYITWLKSHVLSMAWFKFHPVNRKTIQQITWLWMFNLF